VTTPMVIAAMQGPLVALVLIASARAKIRMDLDDLDQIALVRLASRWQFSRARTPLLGMWLALAAVEASLAIWLLLGLAPVLAGSTAALFFLVAVVYLSWALRYGSGSSCGCFSARTPASSASVARAACLCAAGAAYAWSSTSVWRAARRPFPAVTVAGALLIELFTLFMLSPEVRDLSRLYAGAARQLIREQQHVSLESFRFAVARAKVESTRFWSEHICAAGAGVDPQVVDKWVAGSWVYHEYAGSWYGRPATIASAVLPGDQFATWRLVVSVASGRGVTIVAAYHSAAEVEWSRKGSPLGRSTPPSPAGAAATAS
jgi:hypothetical protein